MNSKIFTIEKILGKGGLLSKSLSDFEFRPAQVQMAGLIEDALIEKKQGFSRAEFLSSETAILSQTNTFLPSKATGSFSEI